MSLRGAKRRSNLVFKIKIALLALAMTTIAFLCADPPVYSKGNLSICMATVKRVDLKNDQGEWITVIEPDKAIDIENDPLSISFFNSGRIPAGNYENFRVVLSEHFQFSGEDHGNFTTEGGELELRGDAKLAKNLPGIITAFKEKAPTWNDKTEGMMKEHFNFNNADPDDDITIVADSDLKSPIKIAKGSFVQIEVEIHTGGSLRFASSDVISFNLLPSSRKGMLFLFPNQIENLVVTVDGDQRIIPGEQVKIAL